MVGLTKYEQYQCMILSMSHNGTASKFIILLSPIWPLENFKIFKTWKDDCAETLGMNNNWEILPGFVEVLKGKNIWRGKIGSDKGKEYRSKQGC